MPTGDPNSSGHNHGPVSCSTCWDQSFSRTCCYFSGLRTSNIPRYFLDFASYKHPSIPIQKLCFGFGDVLSIHNPDFHNYLRQYTCILQRLISKTRRRATYTPLLLTLICTSRLGGKANFALPCATNLILISILKTFRSKVAISHLRPPMAFLSHISYDTPGFVPHVNVLFLGLCDFPIRVSYTWTFEIVSWEVLWSIRGSYQILWSILQDILELARPHAVTPSNVTVIRMFMSRWTKISIRTSVFYKNMLFFICNNAF